MPRIFVALGERWVRKAGMLCPDAHRRTQMRSSQGIGKGGTSCSQSHRLGVSGFAPGRSLLLAAHPPAFGMSSPTADDLISVE